MLAPSLSLVAIFLSAVASAAPAPAVTDDIILQYALTLEHLEAAFYKEALGKFNDSSFASGGEERALFEQIAGHEATHVTVLQSLLGDKATKACNYSFPYNDVQGFKSLAQVLEGVGVSAYLGAAQFLTSKELLTAAGSILTTEARHAAWLATTNVRDPWAGAFDTPLAFSQIFSLAAPFITSCPETNPALPVKAFPNLTLSSPDNGGLLPGDNVTLSVPQDFAAPAAISNLHAAFLTGTAVSFVPYTVNQSLTLPPSVNSTGTIYVVLTNSNTSATDDTTVAGPAVLIFDAQFPEGVVAGSSTQTIASGNGTGSTGGSTKDDSSDGANTAPRQRLTRIGIVAAVSLALAISVAWELAAVYWM